VQKIGQKAGKIDLFKINDYFKRLKRFCGMFRKRPGKNIARIIVELDKLIQSS
jgi:hypothetical protein